jgi:hypothetical protein
VKRCGKFKTRTDRKPLSHTSRNFSAGMAAGLKAPNRRPKREKKTL